VNTVTVALPDLNNTVRHALENLGLTGIERETVQQVLMYAQMRGSSQGLIKIKERTVLKDEVCRDVKIENKSSSIATVDGGGHTGMFVLNTATMVAADLVRTAGIALVSTHNTRSSTGAISYYATELANQGFIAIVLAGSPKVTAIEGGTDPVFGTNPIAFAIPTNQDPLVFDMATSAMTWFAIINARDTNCELPEGVAFDRLGAPTTDPQAAMQGALTITGDDEDNRSNTVIAIDPAIINSDFTSRASELIERLRATRLHTNHQSLRLPGEHSAAKAKKCLADNEIIIDANLYRHLLDLASE